MNVNNEWSIEPYIDSRGHAPVIEFLKELGGRDPKAYNRFQWSLDELARRNVQAREPLVRPVEGKIWELREESNTNIYRILYFFFSGRRIVLLHAFTKKTQKLPQRELESARR